MGNIHAKFSPSASKRWLGCPGVIKLYEQVPEIDDMSLSAAEGIAAHQLAEDCFRNDRNADYYLNTTIEIRKDLKFKVTKDFAEAVQVYLSEVRNELSGLFESNEIFNGDKPFLRVEEKVEITKDCFGTCDAYIYSKNLKKLVVYDYKNGIGEVSIEGNTQLMIYAFGVIKGISKNFFHNIHFSEIVDVIELVIVQPNLFNENARIKRSIIKVDTLIDWVSNSLLSGIQEALGKNPRLSVGNHCTYCKAMTICPEQIRHAEEALNSKIDPLKLEPANALTPEQISKILKASPQIINYFKDVERHAFFMATEGVQIEGFKLVEKKKTRKFNEEAEPLLRESYGNSIYEYKMLSVAQMEAMLKKLFNLKPNDIKEKIRPLLLNQASDITLVSESDRRPAVVIEKTTDNIANRIAEEINKPGGFLIN